MIKSRFFCLIVGITLSTFSCSDPVDDCAGNSNCSSSTDLGTKGDMGVKDDGETHKDTGPIDDVRSMITSDMEDMIDMTPSECEPICSNGQVCDTDGFTCVDCLADDNCDGAQICDVVTHTCVNPEPASSTQCESCSSDAQCGTGHHCVPMGFGSLILVPRGNYCLKIPTAQSPCEAPFATPINGKSLGSQSAMQYCAINEQVTTCEAVLAELKETYCGDGGNNGEGNADITKCPQDAGALCEDVIGQKRCTYGCDENSDCEFGCTASGYCL